jgi:coatomer subunit zeta
VNYYKPPHGLPDGSDIKTFQPYLTKKEQLAFEKGLCEKTNKQNHEVLMYDDKLVIYKHEGDVCLYVVGGQEENELMLYSVLAAIKDALNIVLK